MLRRKQRLSNKEINFQSQGIRKRRTKAKVSRKKEIKQVKAEVKYRLDEGPGGILSFKTFLSFITRLLVTI